MQQLLAQARELLDRADLSTLACDGDCSDCLLKQLQGFEQILTDWEARLAQGAQPRFGDPEAVAQQGWVLAERLLHAGLLTPHDLPGL
ncbi:hypothetical protein [Rhabdochromatium marinum]|uniref:hypothetical protein n=1 Tax=Rhabdochromatium marinum TaxID=48729 RepID=UPI001903118B|nr:hypothetical protein [Rhabdochromatium marinum]MBK1647805.1 hypothetical protein [Rhabdochromatium marinum]